ncbi:MAG: tRNA (adenosine(37)-N6)-dimethylallyltransferase MiaA [Candidatus Eisenbacteria sp.]|nr:tRNA (adenosine(37)-N6)-dimethylallyltransferase MiaA [Candidatus Eisenbacteria bacterium]
MTDSGVPILLIVGPTAVGKTEISVLVAEHLNGEIISADSRQIYRGMDIGTAKPEPQLLARAAHHLIDVADPGEDFNAVRFAGMAREAIVDIHGRGRYPIVVGGSGLYIRALLDGLFLGPPASPRIRAELQQVIEELGSPELHARLEEVDADAAQAIHPNDAVRIVRAMEVFMLTGDPISRLRERVSEDNPPLDATVVGLTRNREDLYDRINRRVDQMMDAGLVDEVRRLVEQGRGGERSWDAVGYREIAASLRGDISLEQALQQIRTNSRRYAKRQITWFSKDPRVQWIALSPASRAKDIAEEIVALTARASNPKT